MCVYIIPYINSGIYVKEYIVPYIYHSANLLAPIARGRAMDLVRVAALLLCFEVAGVVSEASDHRYKQGDPVPLYANKVGPFHNPR